MKLGMFNTMVKLRFRVRLGTRLLRLLVVEPVLRVQCGFEIMLNLLLPDGIDIGFLQGEKTNY